MIHIKLLLPPEQPQELPQELPQESPHPQKMSRSIIIQRQLSSQQELNILKFSLLLCYNTYYAQRDKCVTSKFHLTNFYCLVLYLQMNMLDEGVTAVGT